MNPQLFVTVFLSVFVAELGDKTQLATLLFATEARNPKLTIFLASALALTTTSALGVLAGSVISAQVSEKTLSWVAGAGFIAIGLWTIARNLQ